MRFDWILSPITQYSFLIVTLVACLTLFLSLKVELAVALRTFADSRDQAEASAATLAAELATLRQAKECDEAATFTGQELTLTRRAQAVRMQRRGESPSTIAAALRLPRNEIDLLLKVQRLTDSHGMPPENGALKLTQPSA